VRPRLPPIFQWGAERMLLSRRDPPAAEPSPRRPLPARPERGKDEGNATTALFVHLTESQPRSFELGTIANQGAISNDACKRPARGVGRDHRDQRSHQRRLPVEQRRPRWPTQELSVAKATTSCASSTWSATARGSRAVPSSAVGAGCQRGLRRLQRRGDRPAERGRSSGPSSQRASASERSAPGPPRWAGRPGRREKDGVGFSPAYGISGTGSQTVRGGTPSRQQKIALVFSPHRLRRRRVHAPAPVRASTPP